MKASKPAKRVTPPAPAKAMPKGKGKPVLVIAIGMKPKGARPGGRRK